MEERPVDLIQEDLDGTIDPGELDRLEAALEQDPERAIRYEKMEHLFDSLNHLPAVNPPGDLRAGVMRALPPPVRGPTGSLWRLLYPLAAGIALGIALHALAVRVSGPETLTDLSALYGTMIDPSLTDVETGPRHVISAGGLGGWVQLRAAGETAIVEIRLTSDSPYRVDLKFHSGHVRFAGLYQNGRAMNHLIAEPGGLRLRAESSFQARLVFVREVASPDPLLLEAGPVDSPPVSVTLEWPGPEVRTG